MKQKGFSLIELMIVVAIIGVLSAIAVPNFSQFARKARQAEAKTALSALYAAEKAFFAESGLYYHNIIEVGYLPEGNLKYNVGFGLPTGPSPAEVSSRLYNRPFTRGNNQSNEYCLTSPDCTSSTSVFVPWHDVVTPTGQNFVMGAVGNIGLGSGATELDYWTLSDGKVLTHAQDGSR